MVEEADELEEEDVDDEGGGGSVLDDPGAAIRAGLAPVAGPVILYWMLRIPPAGLTARAIPVANKKLGDKCCL